jgi:hypothetical protein
MNQLWVLMGKAGNVANWVLLSNSIGALLGLTGNTGGLVGPTLGNINIVGTGDISVAGNPGTSTLTISLAGAGNIVSTLTGNSGGAVSPSAGNINVIGDGVGITIAGNPGTHTLTASLVGGGEAAQSFITSPATGTATPNAGVLTFAGTGGITTSAAGHTVTITGSGGTLTSLTTSTDGNVVTPTAGNINLQAGTNTTITGTVGPNTVTINVPGGATRVNFLAYLNTMVSNVTGDGTNYRVIFDTATVNTGGGYSTGTGIFTAPVTGVYIFSTGTTLTNLNNASFTESGMYISQFGTTPFVMSDLNIFAVQDAVSNKYTMNGTVILPLTAGQTASVFVYVSGVSKTVGVDGLIATNRQSWFSGSLLI